MALMDTPICDFGWQAPDFTLSDPHGTPHALKDYLGGKGLLIMFICNHCPYVKAITRRLSEDANTLLNEGIHVLAISSNDYEAYPEDSPENMAVFTAVNKFPFPYLVDETQAVARAYNAVCTPDFFGFTGQGALHYRGRLDDAGRADATDRTPELINAMRQIAETGHGPKHQVPSMGCSIKWR